MAITHTMAKQTGTWNDSGACPVNPEVKSAAQKRSFFSRSPQGWVVTTPRSPQPTGAAVAPQYG
ncbi:MAG: hypothetical protein QJT81_14145 [Candidatus Thiothrix putei]|uniref:Uncharacterized protein n=1 Tax=Candidatus Thiothrix putei TaxID=3080811 RepID=A0AA95HC83_9GAMM|nr:MAG: hypothetical protein QJT81_14145 [Candidatus Thiothrix putei]